MKDFPSTVPRPSAHQSLSRPPKAQHLHTLEQETLVILNLFCLGMRNITSPALAYAPTLLYSALAAQDYEALMSFSFGSSDWFFHVILP